MIQKCFHICESTALIYQVFFHIQMSNPAQIKHLYIERHSLEEKKTNPPKKGGRNQLKSTPSKLMWPRPRFYLLNTLAPGALAGAGLLSAVSDPDLAPLNTDGATLPIRSEHRQIGDIRLDTGCQRVL